MFDQTWPAWATDRVATLHTSKGDIQVRLFAEKAPKTVENFIWLATRGKYDGVPFHRVIEDFMIQGGDYENQNGTWGKSIWWKEFEDEFDADLRHIQWALCMANAGPNTNGSQFFIVHAPETPWLDDAHTVFWQVVEWMQVVDDIATVTVDGFDRPIEPILIEWVST